MGVYNDSTPVPPAGYRRLGPESPLQLPLAPWIPYSPVGYTNQYSQIQPRAVAAFRGREVFGAFDDVPGTRDLFLTSPNMRGEDVRFVQDDLLRRGLLKSSDVDGVWGPTTDAAFRRAPGPGAARGVAEKDIIKRKWEAWQAKNPQAAAAQAAEQASAPAASGRPRWFWWAVGGAGVLVLAGGAVVLSGGRKR